MIPALAALLSNTALLLLIGLGPSLALAGEAQGFAALELLALAPALGLALVAWLASLLAFCGLALGPYIWPGTGLLLALSAGLLMARRAGLPALARAGAWPLALAMAALALLLLLPQALGGPGWGLGVAYGADVINYAQQARAYAQLGWHAVHSQGLASFTLAHPEFLRARFMADRLGTPFVLAWQARWAGLGEAPWALLQGVQGLALALPLAWLWLRRAGARAWPAAWAGLLACAGFWAVLSLRLAAVSWSCGLPLLMALGLQAAVLAEPKSASTKPWRSWLLAGLLLQGLALIYPELLLPLALLFAASLALARGRRGQLLALGAASLLIALLADPPALAYHLRFLAREAWGTARLSPAYAEHSAHNFLALGFAWLEKGPGWAWLSRAAWGYCPAPAGWAWGQAWELAGDLAGLASLAGLGLAAWLSRHRLRPAAAQLLAMAIGAWLLAGLAAGLAAPGISGKLCTYSGPFLALSLGLALSWPLPGAAGWLKLPLLLLMALQSAILITGHPQLCGLRPPFPGHQRQGIACGPWGDELGPLRAILDGDRQGLLVLDVADPGLANWAMLTLEPRPMDSLNSLGLDDRPPNEPGRTSIPRWLLMDRQRLAGLDARALPLPAGLSEHFALFHLGPGALAALSRALSTAHGSWLSASQVSPGIMEYRFLADGATRLRASIKPRPGAQGLKASLVLDRQRFLLAQALLARERSVSFTPPPGVGRLGVVVAAPGQAQDVAVRLRPLAGEP
jgi:hypothetical protein